jgi:hypothetical protein
MGDQMRDAYDDGEVTRDGESVRVRLNMMDSMQRAVFDAYGHQPGYVRLTDAQAKLRREARDAMIRRVTTAWKRDAPPPEFTCPSCKGTGKDVDGDSPDGRCDECGGTGYIRGPNNLSSSLREDPGKYPDTDLKVDRIADARRAANDSYRKMCSRLESAWRMKDAEPDNSSSLAEWRRGTKPDDKPTESYSSVEARRAAQWNSWRAQLENAWRGRTDPSAATRTEERLERERGKYA